MNLRFKIAVLMIAAVDIFVIITGFAFYQGTSEILKEANNETLYKLVATEKKLIVELINKEMLLPDYLTIDPDVKNLLTTSDDATRELVTKKLNQHLSDASNLEGIFLINTDGIVIADPNPSVLGLDLSDRAYHISTLKTGESSIGDTVISRKTDQPIFVVTHPVFDDSQLIGYIATVVNAFSMGTHLHEIQLNFSDNSLAYLIDSNGNYLYYDDLDIIGTPLNAPVLQSVIDQVLSGQIGNNGTVTHTEEESKLITAYSFIPDSGWFLFVTQDNSAPLQMLRSFTYVMLFTELLLISAASLFAYFLSVRISSPIIKDLQTKNTELVNLNEELITAEEEMREHNQALTEINSKLEVNEAQYRTLLNNAKDLVYSCLPDSTVIAANDKFIEAFSLTQDLRGVKMDDLVKSYPYYNLWLNHYNKVCKKGEHEIFEYDYHDGNRQRYFAEDLSPVLDTNGKVIGITGAKRDITQRKENEATILNIAYSDALTGLTNRSKFFEQLSDRLHIEGHPFMAIAFIDIDNFKHINDTFGHTFGDRLLVAISMKLQSCLGPSDILARISGDEFAILIESCSNRGDVSIRAEKILTHLNEPIKLSGILITASISMGISLFPENGTTIEELMRYADIAMYKVKLTGKNNFKFFNALMKEDLIRRNTIEKQLSIAIREKEFTICYQPQYNLSTNTIRGFEALIRWSNSKLGTVSPAEFIPIAEETGHIVEIGQWVLNASMEACARFLEIFGDDIKMSINISPIQFQRQEFFHQLTSTIERLSIPPANLEFEITETVMIKNEELILEQLNKIRKLGIGIALDDFGTGYSSLSHVRKLPITVLKIDKSFVSEITRDKSYEIIDAVIAISKKLNILCIAEGVESAGQDEYLRKHHCDIVQGYYYSKPLPEEAVNESLRVFYGDTD